MKNLALKASLVASLLVSQAFAESAFIGFEGDYSFKSNIKGDGGSIGKGQAGLGIKAGYDFDTFRVYGAYVYDLEAKKDSTDENGDKEELKWNKHSVLIGGDYTPSIGDSFKLLAGAYTGVSRINIKVRSDDESGKVNFTGVVVGAKLGAIYEFDKNNAVEFGYKADYTKYSKKNDASLKETNHGLFVGYTYKF
ncbi:outer membrane beta-barrel protein [Campylobacter mucosalis]|uniref:outer membrane beta-barrel protein n=1 Tax=Campylobacter mucosalis TaxID=202 RepID=UPI00146FE4A6|nr:outer membrane beta-barrel protein [Campylobacter mucosalis]